jgi:hypothetical protein
MIFLLKFCVHFYYKYIDTQRQYLTLPINTILIQFYQTKDIKMYGPTMNHNIIIRVLLNIPSSSSPRSFLDKMSTTIYIFALQAQSIPIYILLL